MSLLYSVKMHSSLTLSSIVVLFSAIVVLAAIPSVSVLTVPSVRRIFIISFSRAHPGQVHNLAHY